MINIKYAQLDLKYHHKKKKKKKKKQHHKTTATMTKQNKNTKIKHAQEERGIQNEKKVSVGIAKLSIKSIINKIL